MNIERFQKILKPVTDFVSSQIVSLDLAEELNRRFPHNGETFNAIEAACHEAISDGWMCVQGTAGRRFGRVIAPSEETGKLSVDVVDLKNIIAPHHRHPTGEICMIMPVTDGARFDGETRAGVYLSRGPIIAQLSRTGMRSCCICCQKEKLNLPDSSCGKSTGTARAYGGG